MNKISTLLLAFFCSSFFYAQETTSPQRSNDVMISPIELIVIPVLNVSYEKLLNENSGVGVNAFWYLGNNDEDDDYRVSQIAPYYRFYFGKKYASGFFVEGFVPVVSFKESIYHYDYVPDPGYYQSSSTVDSKTKVGIGIGCGGKWVAKRNIIFEASFGVGRLFESNDDYANVTAKGMLGIGYRF